MSSKTYSIKTIPSFVRELKKLAKKYPSLKDDLTSLVEELRINPEKGIALGDNTFTPSHLTQ